jgi:repressor of nif and glnA expression
VITIKITNVEDVVEKNQGWFVANVIGAVIDLESRVEDVIIEKLRTQLEAEGVHAVIERTQSPTTIVDSPSHSRK